MPIIFDDDKPAGVSGRPREGCMDLVATHQRLLVGSVLRTIGPILELGVGWYSTPILHEIAVTQKRQLITIDNNIHWLLQFSNLANQYHSLLCVGWWGEMYEKLRYDHYGVVFCDQGQPIEREYAIRGLLKYASVFVLHDTEEEFAYGYSRTLPMFKYKYTDRCQKAWTTVASNEENVNEWFADLPPVEPTTEVT